MAASGAPSARAASLKAVSTGEWPDIGVNSGLPDPAEPTFALRDVSDLTRLPRLRAVLSGLKINTSCHRQISVGDAC